MAVTYPDAVLRPVAEQLLACLCTAAAANPFPPGSCGLRPFINGAPLAGLSEDECCDGLAALYVSPAYPSNGATVPDPDPVRCKLTWSATFQLVIWRCAATGDIWAPPTPEQWTELNLKLFDDFATLRDAVCCFIKQRTNGTVRVGNWEIIDDGPEGGCIGSSLTIDAGLR